MSRKSLAVIVSISFLASVFLGWMDHETKDLVHLFTAEFGNILALIMYTILFTLITLGVKKMIS